MPDYRAAREEWTNPGWEVERLATMFSLIAPTDIILDVGSEQGDLSALYAQWASEGGVYLIEPNPKAWPNIRCVFEANNVMPLGCYVGFASDENTGALEWPREWPQETEGELTGETGFLSIAESGAHVQGVRLDMMPRADIITMDVEGAEHIVLRGATGQLANNKPIVFVSIHPWMSRDSYDASDQDVHRIMRRYGYEAHYLGMDHEQHWMFRHPDGR
jgi:FkbM family methyltransferase